MMGAPNEPRMGAGAPEPDGVAGAAGSQRGGCAAVGATGTVFHDSVAETEDDAGTDATRKAHSRKGIKHPREDMMVAGHVHWDTERPRTSKAYIPTYCPSG